MYGSMNELLKLGKNA